MLLLAFNKNGRGKDLKSFLDSALSPTVIQAGVLPEINMPYLTIWCLPQANMSERTGTDIGVST